MKKYLLILAFTMTCTEVVESSFFSLNIYRCENKEVVCYTKTDSRSGIYCHFKDKGNI